MRLTPVLLIALVALLLLYPYLLDDSRQATGALRLFAWVIPLFGVYAVSDDRWKAIVGLVLGIPTVIGGIQDSVGSVLIPPLVTSSSALLFFGFTTVVILSRVVRSTRVTSETLYGAISAYLLLGLTWMTGYSLLEVMNPGSFAVSAAAGGALTALDLLYFSFVTLTTLGYGDITPVTSQAQSLAFLEAVSGVMYLTVLVARLVALYVMETQRS